MAEENSTETVDQTQTETSSTTTVKVQTLTKRNEDFMFQLKKHLDGKIEATQLEAELATIKEALLDGQLTGATAKQLYGTPSEAAAALVNPKKQKANAAVNDAGFWPTALDNGLLFLSMFALLFGFFMFFNKAKVDLTAAPYGIISLILTAVSGGLIFAYIQGLIVPNSNKPKKPFWHRLIAIILAVLLWMIVYMGVALIPRSINPILPGFVYIIIAVVGFGARIYERRVTGITGGFFDSQRPKN